MPEIVKLQKKGAIMMKLTSEKLNKDNIPTDCLIFEYSSKILEHLYSYFNEVLSPLMQNPDNQVGWTDLVAKDLMEKFNNYIA